MGDIQNDLIKFGAVFVIWFLGYLRVRGDNMFFINHLLLKEKKMKTKTLLVLILPIFLLAIFAEGTLAAEKSEVPLRGLRVDGAQPPPKHAGPSPVLYEGSMQPDCEDINPVPDVVVIQHSQWAMTYYDYQKNGSMGRMIAVSGGGHRHMICHETRGDYATFPRFITYNCKNPLDEWCGGSVGYWVDGGTGINAGYGQMLLLHDGAEIILYHRQGSPIWHSTLMRGDAGTQCECAIVKMYDIPDEHDAYVTAENGYWPKGCIVSVGEEDYIHIVTTEHTGGTEELTIAYQRCYFDGDDLVCESPGYGPYTIPPDTGLGALDRPIAVVDTIMTISAIAVSSPVSQKVAIVYTKNRDNYDTQVNHDVVYIESMNNGDDWFTSWPPTIYNVTNYAPLWPERAYCDVAACYDYNDSLHIVWNGCYYDSANGELTFDANLYHWSEATGISMIADGYWRYTNPGVWNRNICKMSISAKDPIYHPGGDPDSVYLFCTWTQFDPGDMSLGGFSNGDIYAAGSKDGGATWGARVNLTNTKTPDCAPGECLSEHWSSLAENMHNGDLHIAYVCDRDAGAAIWGEGDWTDNPMMYLHLEQFDIAEVLGCCQLGPTTCATSTEAECEDMEGIWSPPPAVCEDHPEGSFCIYPYPITMIVEPNDTSIWDKNYFSDTLTIQAIDFQTVSRVQYTVFEYFHEGSWHLIDIDYDGTTCMQDPWDTLQPGGDGWQAKWYPTDLSEGYYMIRVTMVDSADISTSDMIVQYYDPYSPEVTITYPDTFNFPTESPLDIYFFSPGDYITEMYVTVCPIPDYPGTEGAEMGKQELACAVGYNKGIPHFNQHHLYPNGSDDVNRGCSPTSMAACLKYWAQNGFPCLNNNGAMTDAQMVKELGVNAGTKPNSGTKVKAKKPALEKYIKKHCGKCKFKPVVHLQGKKVTLGRLLRELWVKKEDVITGDDTHVTVVNSFCVAPQLYIDYMDPLTGTEVQGPWDVSKGFDGDPLIELVIVSPKEDTLPPECGIIATSEDIEEVEPGTYTYHWDVDTVLYPLGRAYFVNVEITDSLGHKGWDMVKVELLLCGDANGDGSVNIADVVYIITYLFLGGPPPYFGLPFCPADANGDGVVNVGDAVYIVAYLFLGGPPPTDCQFVPEP